MGTPPSPGFPAVLLTVAARWGFYVATRGRVPSEDIGVILERDVQQALIAVETGPRLSDWAIVPCAEVPAKLPGYQLTRETYDILTGGETGPEGAVIYEGRCYRIHATWNGSEHVAEALAS